MCRTLVCSEVGMSNDLIKDKHFNKSCAGMTGFAIWKNWQLDPYLKLYPRTYSKCTKMSLSKKWNHTNTRRAWVNSSLTWSERLSNYDSKPRNHKILINLNIENTMSIDEILLCQH